MRTARAFAGAALLALAVLTPHAAIAQCGPIVVGNEGGEVTAVAQVHATMLLVGMGRRLSLVDISNPAVPTLVSPGRFTTPTIRLDSPAMKIAMTPGGTRAYVLEENGHVDIISLSSLGFSGPLPNDLYNNGQLPGGGFRDILADGEIVYAVYSYEPDYPGTDAYSRIYVYDTTSGTPTHLSTISPLSSTYVFDRVTKIGNTLWAAFHEFQSTIYGIGGYDFTDPSNPQMVTTSLNNISFSTYARIDAIAAIGSRVFIAYNNEVNTVEHDWIRAFDVTNPSNVVWDPGVDSGGSINDMSSVGTELHVARGAPGDDIWQASNPSALSLLGTHFVQVGNVYDVYSVSGTDYVAAGPAGLVLLNTTNPASVGVRGLLGSLPATPTILRTTAGNPATVAVYDGTWGYLRLFTTTSPGLQEHGVIVVGGASAMELDVQPSGTYACVGVGTTIQIKDISNPDAPINLSTLQLGGGHYPELMAAYGTRLYVFDSYSELVVIDMTNPSAPAVRSTTQYGGSYTNYTCMTAWANTVALGTTSFGLWLIDTTNAASPLVAGIWNPATGYDVYGLVKGPSYLYASARVDDPTVAYGYAYRLESLDVTSLNSPTLTWRADSSTGGDTGPVEDLSYVGNATNKFVMGIYPSYDQSQALLKVFDATNQAMPIQIEGAYLWGARDRVAPYGVGTRLLAATGSAGVADLLTPTQWPPAFVRQPQSVSVCFGQDVVFDLGTPAVSASPASVTYQWYQDSTPLVDGPTASGSIVSGAMSPTLTIHNLHDGDAKTSYGYPHSYYCEATNTCGSTGTNYVYITACLADVNCDGSVNVFDLLDYLSLWFAHDPSADFTGDSTVDVFDLLAYLSDWFNGCA